jgi:hypothetical protein
MQARSGQLYAWLLVAALACSSRYYQVGAVGDDVAAGAAGSGGAVGTGRAGDAAASSALGGASGLNECDSYPPESPPVWQGPFAAPAVIWERISMIVYGTVLPSPSTLPEVASAEWAGAIAVEAFADSAQESSGAPLVQRYLTSALGLPEDGTSAATWASSVSGDVPVLDVLLTQSRGEQGRVGILTEPEWLTSHPSIVNRAVTILRGVLNSPIPTPPASVPTLPPPEAAAGTSERERLAQHRAESTCAACHSQIDPFGLALSHFDETGAYRDTESGLPIDSSGTVSLASDYEPVTFTSIEDLAPQLAASCSARLAFADLNFKLALNAAVSLPREEPLPDVWLPDRDRTRWAFVNGSTYMALVRAIAQTNPILR